MYNLVVLTQQGYKVAVFQAGSTMREANAFYTQFVRSGLYDGYRITIREE